MATSNERKRSHTADAEQLVPVGLAGKLALPIPELARAVGCGKTLIYEEAKAGRLRIRKIGLKKSVVLIEDALAWLRGRP